VDWVERGIAPEMLPITFRDKNGALNQRILCPYPAKPRLTEEGMDVTKQQSWVCARW